MAIGGWAASDAASARAAIHELCCRHDRFTRPIRSATRRGDRRAEQHQFERAAFADQARQALRPCVAGQQAEIDFRLSQLRRVRRDAKGACHRQLAAAAQRVTIDGRDDRLAEVLDQIEDVLARACLLAAGDRREHGELVDIGAGDERTDRPRP